MKSKVSIGMHMGLCSQPVVEIKLLQCHKEDVEMVWCVEDGDIVSCSIQWTLFYYLGPFFQPLRRQNGYVLHGTGIVCVSMKEEDLKRLNLPLMVNQKENEENLQTAFTVIVDAKNGTTTWVSTSDKVTTVLTLASKDSKPEDFNRSDHIFPLKYREGGVLKRVVHTEASNYLPMLFGSELAALWMMMVPWLGFKK
ncbi:hypothetical protein ACFE04_019500 [Oxalis oulophora]